MYSYPLFTNFIVVQIIEALEGKVLLLNLFDDLLWKLAELTQGRH